MRTLAEFEPIALWMGMRKVKPFGMTEVWYRANGEVSGKVSEKTSLTNAEVVEALQLAESKGYEWELHGRDKQVECLISRQRGDGSLLWVVEEDQPTISAAVEEALLRLIAAEGGKESNK